MTRRPKVWAMHEKRVVEMPEWGVSWLLRDEPNMPSEDYFAVNYRVRAHHAWDAWKQVPGAPAFGSCRVRRVGE